jgi:hypothetical protein
LVAAWWNEHVNRFAGGTRYLCGRPIGRHTALQVLVNGTQRQRHVAALELACLDPRAPLVEVRAPGGRQLRQVHLWTS